jgi:hypothetical protein
MKLGACSALRLRSRGQQLGRSMVARHVRFLTARSKEADVDSGAWGFASNERKGATGLVEMETVVSCHQREGQPVALRPAVAMHPDPIPQRGRRSPPEVQVRAPQRFEERQQLIRILHRVV